MGRKKNMAWFSFKKKKNQTHKAEKPMWVCVNAPLHTDPLTIITHIHVHTITRTHKQLCGTASLWLFPSWDSLWNQGNPQLWLRGFPLPGTSPDLKVGLEKLLPGTSWRVRGFLYGFLGSAHSFVLPVWCTMYKYTLNYAYMHNSAIDFILASHICQWQYRDGETHKSHSRCSSTSPVTYWTWPEDVAWLQAPAWSGSLGHLFCEASSYFIQGVPASWLERYRHWCLDCICLCSLDENGPRGS